MSLLPNRCQIQDDMPMSLGKAIAKAIAPKVDPFAAFEGKPHRHEITEAECRQIKGAAKAASIKELEQDAFENWLVTTCPSGDVDSVHHQWLDSWAYRDFCEGLPSPASETEADRWVEWKGGDCPIPNAKSGEFEIRFRSGSTHLSRSIADAFSWINWGEGLDIVAYRVVKP